MQTNNPHKLNIISNYKTVNDSWIPKHFSIYKFYLYSLYSNNSIF